MNARTGKLLATIGVALCGVGFIVYSAMSNSVGQIEADELMARWASAAAGDRDAMTKKSMGVHGYVEAGSIKVQVDGQKTRREFMVAMNDGRIKVRYIGPTPDTFREGAEVVAKGKLVDEGGTPVFEARELMAKCPSKYEGDGPAGYKGGGEKPLFD